jgi:hypothetical protein
MIILNFEVLGRSDQIGEPVEVGKGPDAAPLGPAGAGPHAAMNGVPLCHNPDRQLSSVEITLP